MHQIIEFVKSLMDAQWIISHGGLYVVMLIIFAETGLFAGFFLPGDSLLFITGMIISQSPAPFANVALDLVYWISLISVGGIVGNIVGYWFGRESGHLLFEKRDTWIFKRKHLVQAHDFYEKRGGAAIILGRFLPIVRTFAPIVAGIVKMNFKKFISFSILGCLAWVISMTLAGYWLGQIQWVRTNLDKIVIALIIITTGPVLIKLIFGKSKALPVGGDDQPTK